MMIQHDVTSPRPYSRIQLVSGTKGYARKYPVKEIVIDCDYHSGHHVPVSENELNALLKKYEHPIVKEVGDKAKEVGGHGGMDFIMDYRLIYCLNNGLPLDQDVYDAAEWSALAELSEKSVANYGMPIKFPDFTRGAWEKLQKTTYYQLPFLEGLKESNVFINDTYVKLVSNQDNTIIRYTTDGREPQHTSTKYTKPFIVDRTTSFKIRIFTHDGRYSPVYEVQYLKVKPHKPELLNNVNSGLALEYFELEKSISSTEELLELKPTKNIFIDKFIFPYENEELPERFGLKYIGYIKIPKEDVYSFSVLSNDGSRLYVANELVVDNDGPHAAYEKTGEVALLEGLHKMELLYFQVGGGKELKVRWQSTDLDKQEISAGYFNNCTFLSKYYFQTSPAKDKI